MIFKYMKMDRNRIIKSWLDVLHKICSEIFVQNSETKGRLLDVLHENLPANFVQDSVLCGVWIHCYACCTKYEKGRTMITEQGLQEWQITTTKKSL